MYWSLPWFILFLCLILLFMCGYIAYCRFYFQTTITPSPITYQKCIDGNGNVYGVLQEMFLKHNILPTTHSFTLYIPCNYTFCEHEIYQVKEKYPLLKNTHIMMIDGCDYLAGKDTLWKIVCNKIGRQQASTLFPESFLFTKPDITLLSEQHTPTSKYIVKKIFNEKRDYF